MGWFPYFSDKGIRTHYNAAVRWTAAVTSANTGHYLAVCPEANMLIESLLFRQRITATLVQVAVIFVLCYN